MGFASMNLDDQAGLTYALEEARIASMEDEVPVGAIIVKEGIVIARGRNRREQNHDPLSHAELEAIREAARAVGDWRLTGCTMYVTLEPCVMCLGALWQARLDRVVFGARDPKGGALSLGYAFHEDKRFNHRFLADYVPLEECELVLKEFFKKKRV